MAGFRSLAFRSTGASVCSAHGSRAATRRWVWVLSMAATGETWSRWTTSSTASRARCLRRGRWCWRGRPGCAPRVVAGKPTQVGVSEGDLPGRVGASRPGLFRVGARRSVSAGFYPLADDAVEVAQPGAVEGFERLTRGLAAREPAHEERETRVGFGEAVEAKKIDRKEAGHVPLGFARVGALR